MYAAWCPETTAHTCLLSEQLTQKAMLPKERAPSRTSFGQFVKQSDPASGSEEEWTWPNVDPPFQSFAHSEDSSQTDVRNTSLASLRLRAARHTCRLVIEVTAYVCIASSTKAALLTTQSTTRRKECFHLDQPRGCYARPKHFLFILIGKISKNILDGSLSIHSVTMG